MTAARTGDVVLKALIEANAEVNARESSRGQTALMWAAAENNAAAIKVLVDAGADIKARTKEGAAPPGRGPSSTGGVFSAGDRRGRSSRRARSVVHRPAVCGAAWPARSRPHLLQAAETSTTPCLTARARSSWPHRTDTGSSARSRSTRARTSTPTSKGSALHQTTRIRSHEHRLPAATGGDDEPRSISSRSCWPAARTSTP